MALSIAIKNCRVVTPGGVVSTGIGIDGERITAIARDQDLPTAKRVIDAKGNCVIPGLVDAHMHLGFPLHLDLVPNIKRETQACAYGGVTTILHMIIFPGDLLQAVKDFVSVYEQNGYVDIGFTAGIWTANQIQQIQALADYGLPGLKLAIPYRGAEAVPGLPGIDDGIVYLTFEEIGRLVKEGYNILCRVHCENIEIFFRFKARFLEQGIEPRSYSDTRPNFIEAEAMHRCIYLAQVTGCPLYVVHMTIKEGVDIIAEARSKGINVVAETCPQYLMLNVNNTDKVLSKVNPPIRHKEDNERLWEGIRDGIISVVGTDHAPVPPEDKQDLWNATVGLSIVESWLPVMLSEGVNKGRITLEKLVELCCFNPAKIYGLIPRKGCIAVGADADLVIVDLNREVTVGEKPVYSGSGFNVFAGWKMKGWPILTMVRGNIVMEEGKVVGKPGLGRYIPSKVR